jgi:alkylation response protein AidB-like acyl-CoA dehydrogenase|tara:strand:+ start:501 stop:1619 length:1119 start_codon:yes stop_codon:yes gene_type:complete
MNFGFNEEQDLLRDQVRRFLDTHCPLAEVRKIMHEPEGLSRQLWKQMGELGWLGLVIPPDHGGVGLSWVDLIVILEETGRSLYPSPFISHCIAASTLAETATESQQKRWLPDLASGSRIASLAIMDGDGPPDTDSTRLVGTRTDGGFALNGVKRLVPDAGLAELYIVAFREDAADGKLALAVIDGEQQGVSTTSTGTMDQTKRTGSVNLENVAVDEENLLSCDTGTIVRLLDKGMVAVTAEIVGAAEGALDITTNYAKERIQFDNPIGKYQSVKHRLAEIYLDIESFKSLLYYAAWTVDESPAELSRSASLAKAYASEAFARIGIDSVHLHGAIGYTAEYDIQLYLKRSKWARPTYGDTDYHYERVATLGEL